MGGGGVADAYDDVEGVVRAEGCARAADGEYGRLSGQGAQPEGLDDGPHQPGGLARAGRSDGQQRGAEEGGVQGDPGGAAGVGVVRVLGAPADPDLAGEHVVAGGAAGQVAVARGVQGGRSPGAQDGFGEGREPVGAAGGLRPGVAEPGHVHVVHPAGADLGGEGVRRVGPPRRPQLGPPVGGGRGGGVRGVVGRRRCGAAPAGGDQCAPAAEAGEGVQDGGDDQGVDHVDGGRAPVELGARDGGDQEQDRTDDRQGVLPDQELREARGDGRREGE
ncbi:hypothetical protein SMICM304S_06298 [Streptomyces microflavus]